MHMKWPEEVVFMKNLFRDLPTFSAPVSGYSPAKSDSFRYF